MKSQLVVLLDVLRGRQPVVTGSVKAEEGMRRGWASPDVVEGKEDCSVWLKSYWGSRVMILRLLCAFGPP
jgi:hypothetical protein